jgi:hypothetical protein
LFRRRRSGRLWLGLSLCYLLLFNALLSAGAGARWEIAQADPLQRAILDSLCRPAGGEAPQGQNPGHHPFDCGICGHACPMGGCVPVAFVRSSEFELAAARSFVPAFADRTLLPAGGRLLYPSDSFSQGPPRAVIRA